MAEQQPEIRIKTAFGELSAGGGIVFIVIALAALTGVGLFEHWKRGKEHDEILCGIRLNAFLQTIPRGSLTWEQVPSEYWGCLPSHLIYRKPQ